MAEDSNVELEVELRLNEESNRTEQKTAPEIRHENSVVETRKHKRKYFAPKELEDYDEDIPVSDGSSGSAGDVAAKAVSEEGKKHPVIELDEFLDKLHGSLTQPSSPSHSHWNEDNNDKTIRHYFKIKRCTVSPHDFVVRYLFGGNVHLYEFTMLRARAEMQTILNFLDQSTSYIDFTEKNLFLPTPEFPDEQSRRFNREEVSKFIMSSSLEIENLSHLLHGVRFRLCKKMSRFLDGKVDHWVNKLASKVKMDPSAVSESDYQYIFQTYLELFGWDCASENSTKLGIPHRDGHIFTVPDIVARKVADGITSQYCAVVEVKRMVVDPTLKHAFDITGILSKSKEEVKPPKIKRVDFKSEEASTVEQTEEKDTNVEDEHPLDTGESPVSASQRKFIKLFFGQLFGSVLAMDCCNPQNLHAPRPLLGIGVVGFRVVFFTFCAEPACHLKDITRDPKSQLKVYMTSELSLLKASDRRKINEILLPLSGLCGKRSGDEEPLGYDTLVIVEQDFARQYIHSTSSHVSFME